MPCGKEEESLFLTAIENSWVHIRRKKRDRMRQLRELPRAPKEDFMQGKMEKPILKKDSRQEDQTPERPEFPDEKDKSTPDISNETRSSSEPNPTSHPDDTNPTLSSSEPNPTSHPDNTNPESMEEETLALSDQARDTSLSRNTETDDHDSSEELTQVTGKGSLPVQGNDSSFLFKCLLNVKNEAPNVLAEMHWVEGQNKDLMNQLCTYLRNQLCRLASS